MRVSPLFRKNLIISEENKKGVGNFLSFHISAWRQRRFSLLSSSSFVAPHKDVRLDKNEKKVKEEGGGKKIHGHGKEEKEKRNSYSLIEEKDWL